MNTLEIFALILIIVSLVFLIFVLLIFLIGKLTKKNIEEAPKQIYKINIDFATKQVEIENRGYKDSKRYVELEEFIYFIVITPDSRPLRDLLKMINMNSSKENIIEKINNLPEDSIYGFSIPDKTRVSEKYFLGSMYFSEVGKSSKNFIFEIEEITDFEEKASKQMLEQHVILEGRQEIFSNISKDIKEIKTKGWILIRIDYKDNNIFSQKSFLNKKIDALKIQYKLKQYGVKSYVSNGLSLYAVINSGRQTLPVNVQTHVNNLFLKTYFKDIQRKKQDIEVSELNVSTVYEVTRKSFDINVAFIKLDLLSLKHEKNRYNKKSYNETQEKAEKIAKYSDDLLISLTKNNKIIKSSNLMAYGKKNKNIKEYFINIEEKEFADIYNYSFKNNINILEKIITFANQEALKNPKFMCLFSIDIRSAGEIATFIKNIKRSNNFFLQFKGIEKSKDRFRVEKTIKTIQESGHKTILVIKKPDEKDLAFFKKIKPKYLSFSQSYKSDFYKDKNGLIAQEMISKSIDSSTEIITIK